MNYTRMLAVKKQTQNSCILAERTKYCIFSKFLIRLKRVYCLHFEEPGSNCLCYGYLYPCITRRQDIEIKLARGFFFPTQLYYRRLNLTSSTRGTKMDTAMQKVTKHTDKIYILGSPQINYYKILTISLFYLRVRETKNISSSLTEQFFMQKTLPKHKRLGLNLEAYFVCVREREKSSYFQACSCSFFFFPPHQLQVGHKSPWSIPYLGYRIQV